jgi:hypothetical protein
MMTWMLMRWKEDVQEEDVQAITYQRDAGCTESPVITFGERTDDSTLR